MKYKKNITFFALITLFIGCDLSFKPDKPVLNGGGEISHVQVNLGGNARTILPDLGNGFSKYVLSAESADNSQNPPQPVTVNSGNNSGTIAVPYGEWVITATAYVNVSGTDYSAAKGSVPLTVNSDYHSITIMINLPESDGAGIFSYKVKFPASGSAIVTLTPMSGGAAVLNTSVGSDIPWTAHITGGIYFLTVVATANSKNATRSEIVHIYPHSTTNVEYVFTKMDFGSSLNLSGTIKVLVNGVQPNYAYLWYSTDQNNWYDTSINFSGNNGSGTWSISPSNLGGATTFYLWVGLNSNIYNSIGKELQNIPVPVDDTAGIDLGTVEFNFNIDPLPANTFVDGDITIPYAEDWYSINVIDGTTYYFWWNSSYRGDGSKTLGIDVYAYTSNWDQIFGSSYAWSDPVSFTTSYSGTVYIRVCGNGTGTYAIGYSTNSYWHNNSLNPANAVPLPANTWLDGNIATPSTTDLYSINVTAGTTYYFWWNSSSRGDGSKTLGIDVYAYTNDWDRIFSYGGGAWDDPVSFTASSSGTVYIRVRASSGGSSTGTYAIGYSTNRLWHNNSLNPANAVLLPANTWRDGNIATPYAADLYSINVTAGTAYYFWWNSSYRGDGSKTLGINVYAYTNDWDHIFGDNYAWDDPVSFTASYNGTVYIRVNGWGNTGTYAVGYSTNSYWHNNTLNPANAVPLPANTWRDGNIATPYTADLYSINVTEGTTYFFWWNSPSYGDGSKTLLLEVYAYTGDWRNIFALYCYDYNAWDDPRSFTSSYSGTVYIRVRAADGSDYTGTYAIGYSTNGFWYNNSFDPPNPTQLNIDTWVDGDIATRNAEDWYSINVTAGTTYYLWRDDEYSYNDKTLPVRVYVYGNAGEPIPIVGSNNSWDDPVTFIANYSGTIYIRVRAYGSGSSGTGTGTYGIMYSDRPWWS